MRIRETKHRVFFLGLLAAMTASACSGVDTGAPAAVNTTPSDPTTETYAPSLGVDLTTMTKVSDNLYYKDIVVGNGLVTFANHLLSVNYTGWLVNGTQFETTTGGTPFPFTFGIGQVIAGWDQGMLGMRVGGTRLLVIGSTLGYGAVASGQIPPSSTLVFNIQLISEQ